MFLTVVGFHVLTGLVCVVTGAIAMLSEKRQGRHPKLGTLYYWFLLAVFASATALSVVRWADDYHLFILGALSFAMASLGRSARQKRWLGWAKVHIVGMGTSYVLLLTTFYVDNGQNLPLWRELPHWMFWVLPSAVGAPIITRALLFHPLVRLASRPS